ncbi:MAG: DHH family phosphoesterase [Oscillospiraceae bacterium]|nr:DHH family phosphoesterase [Oscillospiraceae bacterium]
MRLKELEAFEDITIQCHDNPDADALASGCALYRYFESKGRRPRFIYAGRSQIQKSNLVLMIERLHIPVEYVQGPQRFDGLLITVDCQYGAGNVTRFEAGQVAVIDHHQPETTGAAVTAEICPELGSCATLVWQLMRREGWDFSGDAQLGTALYYGLYTDTNQFSELHNPLDRDMREALPCNQSLITLFRNSNLSLKELEIAGIALIRCTFNASHGYAIIHAQPCDPNILGLISDLVIQVDSILTCVVYNELADGYKLSVRSCCVEVQASELAAYLTEDIGSGGGHLDKAGGFISSKKYGQKYPGLHPEGYFSQRMNEYFDSVDFLYAANHTLDLTSMKQYRKKKLPVGFVRGADVLSAGTPVTIRTLEGDIDTCIQPDMYIMIGIRGEVYPIKKDKFDRSYQPLAQRFVSQAVYVPTLKNRQTGASIPLGEYAQACLPKQETLIRAQKLEKTVKVFTAWDEEKYMLGRPGDFLAVRCDDPHDVYVIERDIFSETYEELGKP